MRSVATRAQRAPASAHLPAGGNGIVQAEEECDDANTADGDCSSSTCEYEAAGDPCTSDGEACTEDVCDAPGTCTHPAGNAGAVCRPDAGDCDRAEHCAGDSPVCPADSLEPNGTARTDDGLFCSGDETCQDGACMSSGDPCAVGVCDEASNQCVPPREHAWT